MRGLRQQQEAEEGEEGDGGWTREEQDLLQAAYCQVAPTHPFFWAEIAKRVPGRSATECFSRLFEAARPPQRRAGGAADAAAGAAALRQVRGRAAASPCVARG
ncbi:MAG: hypothetical protein J3K34DRAFT_461332 [Monoraphidium minutum]|nr:MAG: hypothetical protein J3K34DRAFT_461332 [Monoraphidium minutum]